MASVVLLISNILFVEIDNEGVIEPDKDDPQEMGDESIEVSFWGVGLFCFAVASLFGKSCVDFQVLFVFLITYFLSWMTIL